MILIDPDIADVALPLYTVAQLRVIEAKAQQIFPPFTLMSRAGRATAQFIDKYLAGVAPVIAPKVVRNKHRIWFAVGPGNNGGDALVAATECYQRGIHVEVCMPVAPVEGHADDAWRALTQARAAGVPVVNTLSPDNDLMQYDLAVDGLFGIGLKRAISPVFAPLVRCLTERTTHGGTVLALDVPSGLNSDTGYPFDFNFDLDLDTRTTVKATHTLTFIGAKPGLYTAYGRDYAGKIIIAPLGLDAARHPGPQVIEDEDESAAQLKLKLNAPLLFTPHMPQRTHSSHKGTFGSLAIIGGAAGPCGAPVLAARAALFAGAGKVHVALLDNHSEQAPSYDPLYPELMFHALDALDIDSVDAWVIGCGIGQSEQAEMVCRKLFGKIFGAEPQTTAPMTRPTVIDADALNLIAENKSLATCIAARPCASVLASTVILTPHPLEAARLLKCDIQTVQNDRIAAARELAKQFESIVVLKGSGTIIAAFDHRIVVNPTGNAGLATAGTGDVLSGLIGALLAQRMRPFEAALAAVFLHGRAAESLTAEGNGPAGLTAGEIAPRFRQLLNRLSTIAENTNG